MSNIKKINDIRINLSSHEKLSELKKNINFDSKIKLNFKLDNKKIININNFEININKKKIKYSTYYTNPYFTIPNLVNNINFKKNKNKNITNLCIKLFFNDYDKLENFNFKELETMILKKNKFIGIEKSLLILWYLIYLDKYIELNDKFIYFNLIKSNFISFIHKIFNFNEIINGLINNINIIHKKFYLSVYILCEEFHFKYINKYLESNKKSNVIFNSNYTKINPQKLLNNLNGEFNYNIKLINEEISSPFGHNILFIKSNNNKIYYYDPDEQILSDLYKLKILFKKSEINFLNISNRIPIQTITDDSNCVFYCLGFIKYIVQNNIQFELNKLKLATLLYESFILSSCRNIFNWTIAIK